MKFMSNLGGGQLVSILLTLPHFATLQQNKCKNHTSKCIQFMDQEFPKDIIYAMIKMIKTVHILDN